MLNENLKLEMIVHLNGKMLHDTPLFQNFDIIFISELTYMLKRETYSIDDNIFIVRPIQSLKPYYRKMTLDQHCII